MLKAKKIIPLIMALCLLLSAVTVSAEVAPPDTILFGEADFNGAINAKDAMLILQVYTKKVEADRIPVERCDVDGNGSLNAKDAMLVLQKYTKKLDKFPVCHDFEEWAVEKAATETETGIEYRYCTGCHFKEEREIPMVEPTEPTEPETTEPTMPPETEPSNSILAAEQLRELEEYGRQYGAEKYGFNPDPNVYAGYYPPCTMYFSSMEEGKMQISAAVDSTAKELLIHGPLWGTWEDGTIWRANLNIGIVDRGNNAYNIYVYYG